MSSIWNHETREEIINNLVERSINSCDTSNNSVTVTLDDGRGSSSHVLVDKNLALMSSPKFKQLLQESLAKNTITIKASINVFQKVLNYMYTGREWKFDGDLQEALELLKLLQFLELEEFAQLVSSQLSSPSASTLNKIEGKLLELEITVKENQTQQSEIRMMQEMSQGVLLNLKLEQNLTLFQLREELKRTREEFLEMKSIYEIQLANSKEELSTMQLSLEELSDQLEAQRKIQHSSRTRSLDSEAEIRNTAYQLNLTRMELCDSVETVKEIKQSLHSTHSLVQSQSQELKAQADEIKKLKKSNAKSWECFQKHLKDYESNEEAQKPRNQLLESISAESSVLRKDINRIESLFYEAVLTTKALLGQNQTEIERISASTETIKTNFEEQKSRLNRKSADICFVAQSLHEVKGNLKNFENCKPGNVFPKGFLYFQFPSEMEPMILWPDLKWEKTANRLSQFCACGEIRKDQIVTCRNYFNTNNFERRDTFFNNSPDPRLSPVSPKLGYADSHDAIVIWRRC
ncbi:unnamed protein product [Allacma fusca]|uniref:BTB domain-containing protein n=1 Tax=Allacma fusca TaxID=39272 RepID=A0A8J2K6N7_9HEXA|nr:unnamed protein product [Allacma fusca]